MNKKYSLVTVCVLILMLHACSNTSLTSISEPVKTATFAAVISTPPPTSTLTPTLTPSPTPIPLVWKRVSMGQEFSRDVVTDLGFDPNDRDILYIRMEHAGSYKTIDGGLSWHPIQKDEIPDNIQFSYAIDEYSSHNAQYNTALDGKERQYKMKWKG